MVGCDTGAFSIGFVPDDDCVFISGSMIHEWGRIVKECGSDYPIYLRPFGADGDRVESANWKAKIIDWLKLTEFYEADGFQAGIIKGKCPKCDAILVKEKNETGKDGERCEVLPGDEVRGRVPEDVGR